MLVGRVQYRVFLSRWMRLRYIFAFYLKQCKEAEIFEMNQEHLETQVEGLSGHLEKQDFEEVRAAAGSCGFVA